MEYPICTLSKVTDPNAKRLIDMLLKDNEKLRQRLDKIEHPDNIPEALKEIERRSRNPIYKLSKSIDIISKNNVF